MTHTHSIVGNLLSWSLIIGIVIGFLLNRAVHLLHTCWLNRYRPLPHGRRRSMWQAVSIDARATAALVMVAVVGWSIYKTQENADVAARITEDAKVFAAETRDCQSVLLTAIRDRSVVTEEYNTQSESQRRALANWLRTLLQPPPDIARLPAGDPGRDEWSRGVTEVYFEAIQQSLRDQQEANRRRPPLPDPDCS